LEEENPEISSPRGILFCGQILEKIHAIGRTGD
jgi:hypothetical protein